MSSYEKPQKRVLKARFLIGSCVLETRDASIIYSFVIGQLTKFLAYYSYLERVFINLKQSLVNKAPDVTKSSVRFLSTNLLNPSHSFFFSKKASFMCPFLLFVVQISFYFIISLSLILSFSF